MTNLKTRQNKSSENYPKMSSSEFHEILKKKLAEVGIWLEYATPNNEEWIEVYIPLGRKWINKE